MADTYTKLWSSLLDSSVWGEPDHVRLVWITMLAMKDEHGYVGASVDGIARRANVSIEQAEDALQRLQAPDPRSRSDAHDGRRIEAVHRGWDILNHSYFRDLVDREERRRYEREKKRRQRDRAGTSGDKVPMSPHADADADAVIGCSASVSPPDGERVLVQQASVPLHGTGVGRRKQRDATKSYSPEFLAFWDAYPRKTAKRAAFDSWRRHVRDAETRAAVMAAVRELAEAVAGCDESIKLTPHASTWINQARWEDDQSHSAAAKANKHATSVFRQGKQGSYSTDGMDLDENGWPR